MKAYFGLKTGQSITEFAAELKEISAKDKLEFCAMLNQAGFPTDPPGPAKG
jgi:hypothetical protein